MLSLSQNITYLCFHYLKISLICAFTISKYHLSVLSLSQNITYLCFHYLKISLICAFTISKYHLSVLSLSQNITYLCFHYLKISPRVKRSPLREMYGRASLTEAQNCWVSVIPSIKLMWCNFHSNYVRIYKDPYQCTFVYLSDI